MIPLRVRAWLRCGILCDLNLPLDGILLYQAMRRVNGPRDADWPGMIAPSAARAVTLPLACANTGQPTWFYLCSFAQWPAHAQEGKAYWTKHIDMRRIDMVDMQRASKIQIAKGRYRSYHMPIFYLATQYVEWYCVGRQGEIAELLRDVWAIGKKQSQGWGRVARWEIAPWPDDWSVRHNEQLMRAVPITGTFDMSRAQLAGYRPPYWLPANQALCEMP